MLLKKYTPFARATLHILAVLALLAGVTANVSTVYAAPPSNDTFAAAKKITSNGAQSISDINTATTNLVSDPFSSCALDQGLDTVWYSYTPSSYGELTLNTTNSGFDTVLTVWKQDPFDPGNPAALIEVICNDNAPGKTSSSLTVPVRVGLKYYIEVIRKTGSAVSPPDPLTLNLTFVSKPIALPNWSASAPYDDRANVFIYTATGWNPLVPAGVDVWYSYLHVNQNASGSATVYFDGEQVALEYATALDYGGAIITIDGVYVDTISQGSGVWKSTKEGTAPLWYSPLLSDGVHKLVIKNASPPLKMNIDGLWVAPHADFIEPAAIANLVATTSTSTGKVTLAWTSPGDDGMVGRADHYEVRYSANAILNDLSDPFDPNDWAAATPILAGVPTPLTAGSVQQMTVSGLVPGLTYWFAVRAVDEAGNLGGLSNTDDAIANASGLNGAGKYDDKHSGWTYSGNWTVVVETEAYADSQHIATKLDSSATFYFSGNQFTLEYFSNLKQSLMDIYIDGVYETTIDQYSPNPIFHREYVSPVLGVPGPHVVTFVMVNLPQANIDAITVSTVSDGGPPDPITDLFALTGLSDGDVDLSWTATGDDPGDLVGSAAQYEVRYSFNPILTEVDWFNASIAPGIIAVPQPAFSLEGLTVYGLTPGLTYYFAVRAHDDAHYAVLSNTASAQAYNAAGYAPAGLGGTLYQNTFGGGFWRYNGYLGGAFPAASNGDMHFSYIASASADFTFNGSGFTLFYAKAKNYGNMKIYVDGALVATISQYNLTPLWQRTWSWAGAFGDHTVRFTNVSGSKVTIDALFIAP